MELRVPLDNVKEIKEAQGSVEEGEYWPEDPNQTRLFFGPTAKTIPQGSGYLAVYELIFPFLGVGITDSFVLAGGTPLLFGDMDSRPFWIAPKLKVFDTGRTQGALGVLAVRVDDEDAGLLYGVVTHGSQKSSLSVGLGYGYVEDDLAENPAVMLGGEIRMSPRVKLITENYIFPGGSGVVSLGPRFFGRKLSADLGLAAPLGADEFFAFPLINFVYNF
jgi:hypothetical protein